MSFDLTIPNIPHYTYNDYQKWEGDWELIRGTPYAMTPSPGWRHQLLGGNFVTSFNNALAKQHNKCSCVVLYACDWIVSEDTVVRPDVMIVCEPIKGEHVTTPPVLALEILSPSSILKDRNTKFNMYQAFGVKYYILASVEKAEVEIFELKDNRYHQLNSNQFQFTNSCTVTVDFEDLFNKP